MYEQHGSGRLASKKQASTSRVSDGDSCMNSGAVRDWQAKKRRVLVMSDGVSRPNDTNAIAQGCQVRGVGVGCGCQGWMWGAGINSAGGTAVTDAVTDRRTRAATPTKARVAAGKLEHRAAVRRNRPRAAGGSPSTMQPASPSTALRAVAQASASPSRCLRCWRRAPFEGAFAGRVTHRRTPTRRGSEHTRPAATSDMRLRGRSRERVWRLRARGCQRPCLCLSSVTPRASQWWWSRAASRQQ